MYKCTKTLKEGSFGEVYVAVNLDTGKEVAVKRMKSAKSAEQCNFIYREFDMMKRLKHPNILEAIDFYVCKKSIYLILEFADGGDLDDLLSERGRFPENVATVFFQQIVKGIRYIHSKQIAHLDIKPENILLKNGVVKISDFGVSPPAGDGLIPAKNRRGTLEYIAPELYQHRDFNGKKVDLWALGVTLYVMLTDRFPFDQEGDRESFLAGRYGQPGYVSVGCWCLVRKLIAVDPQARHSLIKITRSDDWLNVQFHSEAFDVWLKNPTQSASSNTSQS